MVSCLVCSSRKPTPLALASRWILQSVLGALTLSGFEWLRDCLWPADLTPSCLSLARQTLTLFSYTSYKLSVPKHGLKGFWRKTDVLVVSRILNNNNVNTQSSVEVLFPKVRSCINDHLCWFCPFFNIWQRRTKKRLIQLFKFKEGRKQHTVK